jgi:hypothetical protein
MESQALNSLSSLEQEDWRHHMSWIQVTFQSFGNQTSMIWASKCTHRPRN